MLVSSLQGDTKNALIEHLSQSVHEANRQYCEVRGDYSLKEWGGTSEAIRESARSGVKFFLAKPCTPQEQHAEWSRFKLEQGYVFGAVKDDGKKTHPCLVPYEELPDFQKAKDELFQTTIRKELSAKGYVLV